MVGNGTLGMVGNATLGMVGNATIQTQSEYKREDSTTLKASN
jgi:hypothetical protein